jgi:DNA-binding CsgD family transcriptional regulator
MGEVVHTVLRSRERAALTGVGLPPPSVGLLAPGPSDFVEELYAAAVDFPRMTVALTSFAAAFDADLAWLIADSDQDGFQIVERTSDGRRLCGGEVEVLTTLTARIGKPESEVQAGSLAVGGGDIVNHLAVVPDGQGEHSWGIAVLRRHQPFTDAERQRARTLVPDIRRALQLRNRALRVDAHAVGRQMFENNPIAIFITRNRAIEKRNAAAASVLATRKPVGVAAGKLHFEDSRAQGAFELLSRSDHGHGRQSFAFVVEGGEGRTWIAQLSLAPLANGEAISHRVLVALTPFSGASQTRETMLEGFTELTPTERAIFAAFVDGDDIAAIAAKMRRSVETVRWHVRNLFTKLGVNSQADLARLGALLLPI